jgi:hypothetical protein
MTILLFLLFSLLAVVVLGFAIIVVMGFVYGAVKYTLNPRAFIADLKASMCKRI